MCPAVVDLVSGVVMPNSVVSLFVVGLILSAMSVFGDGDAEMKKLVEDTKSYREAAQKRFGAAPKAIEAFSATIKNVNLALARNKSTVDINSRDKDHAALQLKLEEVVASSLTFHGPGKQVDRGGLQVYQLEHPKVAAPKALVELLAKRMLEKLLTPEIFVDDKGKVQPFFLFQAAALQAPIKEDLLNLTGGDHGHDLRRNLILMLTEKGDLKSLGRELTKHEIAFFYFTKTQPFDLYVRTYFARRYDDVLLREKAYMNELIVEGGKAIEEEKIIVNLMAGDKELIRRVEAGQGKQADLVAMKALLKQYQDFMSLVDKLPFRLPNASKR